jgi:hypothetical protein
MMKKAGYILLVLVALIATGITVNWWKEQQLIKEVTKRTVLEESIKQKYVQHEQNKKMIDSLLSDRNKLSAIIEYQKQNPQIIIKKYETIHYNIDQLDPNSNFLLFTGNLQKYKSNRERYSLLRFK